MNRKGMAFVAALLLAAAGGVRSAEPEQPAFRKIPLLQSEALRSLLAARVDGGGTVESALKALVGASSLGDCKDSEGKELVYTTKVFGDSPAALEADIQMVPKSSLAERVELAAQRKVDSSEEALYQALSHLEIYQKPVAEEKVKQALSHGFDHIQGTEAAGLEAEKEAHAYQRTALAELAASNLANALAAEFRKNPRLSLRTGIVLFEKSRLRYVALVDESGAGQGSYEVFVLANGSCK